MRKLLTSVTSLVWIDIPETGRKGICGMWHYFLSYMKKKGVFYLLVAPYLLLFILFTVVPVVMAIGYSFSYYNVLEPARFIGPDNYIRLFTQDDVFLTAIRNTLIFAVITGPVSYLLCFGLAWLISDIPPKLRAFLTMVFYTPSIAGGVYVIWTFIFSGDSYGLLNSWLMRLNILDAPIVWLKNASYTMPAVIIVTLWMSVGTSFLSFIAGFQGVDRTLYEAGEVEGIRNRWQELWYITLPMMRPQLLFGAVMQITAAFSVGDVCTALVGFPSVDYSTHTIMNHLTDYGTLRFELGYASAIATILFVMMVLTNSLVKKMLMKVGE